MFTKSSIVNDAYTQLRISGITVSPTPGAIAKALERLEDMMAEFEGRNICLNYVFEDIPDPATPTGVDREYKNMMQTNLAVRLIPDFNKQVPMQLLQIASGALSSASARVSSRNTRQVQYPNRQPRGSGNSLRYNRWQRFYRKVDVAPNDCATIKMDVGEINDFNESFTEYLGNEDITSAVIEVTSEITLVSSTPNQKDIDYRIQANDIATDGSLQKVKIEITTDSGRVELRIINFEITNKKL